MSKTAQSKASPKSNTLRLRIKSLVMTSLAVVFTLMPLVTIGIWTSAYVDFGGVADFLRLILESLSS